MIRITVRGIATLTLACCVTILMIGSAIPSPGDLSEQRSWHVDGSRGILLIGEVAERNARKAAAGWQERYGIRIDPGSLRVFDFDPGPARDLVILSSGLKIDGVATEYLGNGYRLTTDVSDVGQGESSGWAHKRTRCFKRVKRNNGWIDHCFQLHKLTHDGSKERDYYALHRYATAKSPEHTLRAANIRNFRHEDGPRMTWAEWDPRRDLDLDCDTYTVSISYQGVGLSKTYTVCDKWNMTKYDEAGKFSNTWEGEAKNSERDVAFMIAVGVPQGTYARWHHRSEVIAFF